jgi:hydroxyethylthiazole kinase
LLRNGCATMARITGSGCMLTTLIGGFCAAAPEHPFDATIAAMAAMGICGEIAEENRLRNKTGNATFRTDLIDAVFNLSEQELKERIRYEIYQR